MPLPRELTASRRELEEFSRSLAHGTYYGDNRVLCRVLGSFPILVNTRDRILGPRLVLDGYWEAWVTLAIARQVQPGYCCVDVGAAYGYYTLLMAWASGPEGRVLACECNDELCATLINNLKMNFPPGAASCEVTVCDQAVSDVPDQELRLHYSHFNLGGSSILPGSSADYRQIVRTTTLDKLCAHWDQLDLVKIDVEGAELQVWDGMSACLRKFPDLVIVMELHAHLHPPGKIQGFLKQIQQQGYTVRRINYAGDLEPVIAEDLISHRQEHWMLWISRA